jgi:sugar-1,4-lactone oxidase-like protein
MTKTKWTNWSNSFNSYPDRIETPCTERELIEIVRTAKKTHTKIKLVGSGHSCSKIAEISDGILISLDNYNSILSFNPKKLELTVEGGISLKEICTFLKKKKAALANMGTIDPQSIAGAISTGTHGTGIKFGAIDQQVTAIEYITSNGEIFKTSKNDNPQLFHNTVVGLGAIGIISKVTIQCVPLYNLEVVTKSITFNEMTETLDKVYKTDYLRFWWVPHTDKVQIWSANKTKKPVSKTNPLFTWIEEILKGNIIHEIGLWITSFFPKSIRLLNKIMHYLLFKRSNCKIGDFHSMFTVPINVKQSVMEYAIPINKTKEVITEIRELITVGNFNVHMPIELRFAPKNKASLSMAYDRDTCYIGIISYKPFGKKIDHESYFSKVHEIFKRHDGRPHWAKKHFYSNKELINLYPKWEQFRNIKESIDGNKMFENNFIKKLLV